MAANNLKNKTISGMFWTATLKYATMGVYFVSNIILARLLTPYDYGCIGMLSIFIAICDLLIDSGFGSALIQKKRPSDEDYSTVFYWNLAVSSILYIVLFFCAPLIAGFYGIPLLSKVLRIEGTVLIINAFKLIQSNQLRKQFRFNVLAIVTIVSSIISVIISIAMAYNGMGVWALVAQNLAIAFIPMVCYWIITKWKPLLIFSKKSFKELFSFGGFMFLSSALNTLMNNIQGVLIGKLYNPSTMGYYSKAKSTEDLVSNSISQILSLVTYQVYAEVQDDKVTLANMISRMTKTIAYITFPLISFAILCAEPLFVLLYSEKWLPCVPYFRVLCVAGFAICLEAINSQPIAAIGRSKVMFIWTLVKRAIGLGFIIAGLVVWGMKGLLLGVVVSEWFSFIVNSKLVSKYIGYNMKRQVKDLAPIFLICLFSVILSIGVGSFLNTGIYLTAVVQFIVLGSSYLLVSKISKVDSLLYCKELFSEQARKLFVRIRK